MPKFVFTKEDINNVNQDRKMRFRSKIDFDDLCARTEKYLAEAKIDGIVDLVKKNENICWGSTRFPLLVTKCDQKYVIKNYDEYDPKREIEILKVVEKRIAPSVFYFGEEFYIEEFIDHQNAKTLEDIENTQGLETAAAIGAEMMAELAKLKVNYSHNHWLDEFHVYGNRRLITDFGTSTFFWKRGQNKIDRWLVTIESRSREQFLDDVNPIYYFDKNSDDYEYTKNKLIQLGKDAETFANLIELLSEATLGIKRYLENKDYFINACGKTREIFPLFVEAFANKYLTYT